MSAATAADFLDVLRQLPLLETAQREQLPALRQQFPAPQALAQELVQRGWLTPYQADAVASGQGHELVLDQYIILDLLGQGGMGRVYKARQTRMKRLVALKAIRPEALSAVGVARFRREAESAAKLSHPNVVHVYDSSEVQGVHFLVMEYLEGSDLARLVREQGALPVALACDCVRQAALGLQHAHEQGLIHRDVKPHNLMLTPKGVVKVMDLGLARTTAAVRDAGAAEGITGSGVVMGTADYMAPEQALNAKRVDIRADVYSLGCTLYHLLTGQVPFPGETVTEKLLKHHLHEPEPVAAWRSDLPAGLSEVVARMMAKQPEQRYPTPADVAVALEPFAHGAPATSSSTALRLTATPPVPRPATHGEATSDQGVLSATLAWPLANRPRRRRAAVACAFAGLLGLSALLLSASTLPTRQAGSAPLTPVNLVPLPELKPEPAEFTSSNGVKLVLVGAGKFWMGEPEGEPGRQADEAQKEVTIPAAFYLGTHEVTQEQWQAVMAHNPSYFSRNGGGNEAVGKVPEADLKRFPVERVSWDDVQEFLKKLNERDQKINHPGWVYRLPTEAEWEYACRGGPSLREGQKTAPFYFNKPAFSLASTQANFDGGKPYGGAARGPNLGRTCPVGSYDSNPLGIRDMHGNVWEWCDDRYGEGKFRVIRGGAWNEDGQACRTVNRSGFLANSRSSNFGFRLARVRVAVR
ncbi:MAG: SUMF1/EgtB/PvdO family nonheme iron enzyme [Planctomycetia bacterium]|nr:SUMF1/EgtB/PvdO family nonheme iron enzyme [Planctomycetia bacterium]